jgi:hypothetical protein
MNPAFEFALMTSIGDRLIAELPIDILWTPSPEDRLTMLELLARAELDFEVWMARRHMKVAYERAEAWARRRYTEGVNV